MGHSVLQLLSTALGGDSGVVKHSGMIGIVGALILALLVSFLSSTVFMGKKKLKERGVLVEAGGEEGITMRHAGSPELVQVPWEGATTMAALFEQCCQKHSNLRFLGSRKLIERAFVQGSDGRKLEKLHLGEYEWKSYGETFDRASNFASGLVKLGHKLDTRAAIFSDTREEFFIAMQGCFRQNLTVVTVYASLGEDALVHSLNETQASTLICDSKLLEKLVRVGARLEAIQNVIYFEDDATRSGSAVPRSMSNWTVVSFGEVQNLGEQNRHQPNLPAKNDVAMVMYTSGSTGLPKGVMITHGNIVATVAGVLRACPSNLDNEVYLAYLPMAHVLELISQTVMFAVGGAIGYGSALTLTDTSPKIKKGTRGDAAELKPTVMTAVPAILDLVRRGVMKKVEEKGGLASKLFNIAYRRQLAALDGSWFGAWALEKMFWDAIIFKGIRSVLGGRVWYLICGGAPLSGDTHRFINICMGAHVTTAYGLTETFAGATYSEWDEMTVGHVGPPVACSYIKLVSWKEGGYMTSDKPMPRGEIVVGGFSVSLGYFNNEEKTNEVYKVDERGMRWFYTGDIGQFHPDGTVEIIDRKKDIVKLQHGEYVSLGKVEAALKSSDYVDNIMVYADPFYSYSVALVVASRQDLQKWAEGAGINSKDISELCNSDEAAQEVQQSLIEVAKNAKLGKFEIPAKLRLLADPWTPESGLVTNALKIKREQLKIKFKDELQRLYA